MDCDAFRLATPDLCRLAFCDDKSLNVHGVLGIKSKELNHLEWMNIR